MSDVCSLNESANLSLQHRLSRSAWIIATTSLLLFSSANPLKADTPKIWLGALEPQWRQVKGFAPNDWEQLFDKKAPWPIVASHIEAFFVSKRFVRDADEQQLQRVITFLKEQKIKLAMQGTPLVATRECGLGIEGHGPPGDMLEGAERIRSAGGKLDYIAMDEPLYYGSIFKYVDRAGGRVPCDHTIQELAAQTATKIAEVRNIFPSVIIGDIEPFGVEPRLATVWKRNLAEWPDAYSSATGMPLAFMQADNVWARPAWEPDFMAGVEILRSKNVPLGVIYNASPRDPDWLGSAATHFRLIENQMRISPALAVFLSWTDAPARMLPETDPDTMTGLVLQYLRWRKADAR